MYVYRVVMYYTSFIHTKNPPSSQHHISFHLYNLFIFKISATFLSQTMSDIALMTEMTPQAQVLVAEPEIAVC